MLTDVMSLHTVRESSKLDAAETDEKGWPAVKVHGNVATIVPVDHGDGKFAKVMTSASASEGPTND